MPWLDTGTICLLIGGICSCTFCMSYTLLKCMYLGSSEYAELKTVQNGERNEYRPTEYRGRRIKFVKKKSNSVASWQSSTTDCEYSIGSTFAHDEDGKNRVSVFTQEPYGVPEISDNVVLNGSHKTDAEVFRALKLRLGKNSEETPDTTDVSFEIKPEETPKRSQTAPM